MPQRGKVAVVRTRRSAGSLTVALAALLALLVFVPALGSIEPLTAAPSETRELAVATVDRVAHAPDAVVAASKAANDRFETGLRDLVRRLVQAAPPGAGELAARFDRAARIPLPASASSTIARASLRRRGPPAITD
jgi:hypothetical protein